MMMTYLYVCGKFANFNEFKFYNGSYITEQLCHKDINSLMFLVYINELVRILEEHDIKVKLFADDVKMYVKLLDSHNLVF